MFLKSDKKLIDNYLSGDRDAFGEIVKRHKDYVYNLAYRLTNNPSDAEDLTQEIFIRLMDKLESFRGDAKFSTWLYRLATNQCLDWLRRSRPESSSIDLLELKSDDNVQAKVESKEQIDDIEKALTKLPADFRLAVTLRDIEGYSYSEIAEYLDVSIGTVKSRISRGRSLLIKTLKQRSYTCVVRIQP